MHLSRPTVSSQIGNVSLYSLSNQSQKLREDITWWPQRVSVVWAAAAVIGRRVWNSSTSLYTNLISSFWMWSVVTPSPYIVPKSIPSAGQQHFHRQEVEAVLASWSSCFVYVSMHVRREGGRREGKRREGGGRDSKYTWCSREQCDFCYSLTICEKAASHQLAWSWWLRSNKYTLKLQQLVPTLGHSREQTSHTPKPLQNLYFEEIANHYWTKWVQLWCQPPPMTAHSQKNPNVIVHRFQELCFTN